MENKKNLIMGKDDILYFHHIPKTAGTSLISLLSSHFSYDSSLKSQAWNELLLDFPDDFSQFRYIKGHFGYGIHRLLPRKPIYITMLRDPIDSIISYKKMEKRDRDVDKTISEIILREKRPKNIFINHLSRWLVCDFDIVKKTVNYSKDEIKKFLPEHQKEFRLEGVSDDELFEKAKSKLLECAFFGLVEKYEESLFLLHYTFGWKPIRDEARLNADPKKTSADEVTPEVRDLLSERTKADRKLYKFALDLFEYRYNLMIKNLKNEFFESKYQVMDEKDAIFDMLEKHYQIHYIEWNTKTPSIDYKFSEPTHGIGWNMPEKIKTGNQFFRWTGPENFSTIDFPIETKSDLKIQFHVLMWINEEILDSLKLFVNGTQIPIKKSNSLFTGMAKLGSKISSPSGKGKNVFTPITGLGGVFFEGAIPISILKNNNEFTRIAFKIQKTISPKSINPKSGDDRKLGLALDWIRIFPEKMND